jgi:Xaa-Pro aminopeptidase
MSRETRRETREALAKVRSGRGAAAIETRLYLRTHSPHRERWEGPALSPGPDAVEATGITSVLPIERLIPDLLELPERSILFLLDPNTPDPALDEALIRKRPDLALRNARRAIAALRAVKSKTEIDRIRYACELTARGLQESMRASRPGMNEFELQAYLEFSCRRGGAGRQAFDSIVASGPNTTILHYRKNERTIEDGDLVLMDVGGEYRGYAADVTRTFPANGKFTAEQARIYDVVLRAQLAAIAAVRPGSSLARVNSAALEVIREAGLIDGWMHGTSHHVGLDVHDPGAPGPLVPGMVFTVEPGLYFPESGIGIRIEDTVVVTADGCEILSAKITKDRQEIEAIMSAGRLTEERGK